jgi:hypothetical protein
VEVEVAVEDTAVEVAVEDTAVEDTALLWVVEVWVAVTALVEAFMGGWAEASVAR